MTMENRKPVHEQSWLFAAHQALARQLGVQEIAYQRRIDVAAR